MSPALRVLVVDDDSMYLELVERSLKSFNIEVTTTDSAIGVTNLIRRTEPDVVLLDVNIPALSGDALLGIVRNLHHTHEADAIREALLREHLEARDRFLDPLIQRAQDILAANPDVGGALDAITDALTTADRELDRRLWIHTAAALLEPLDADQRTSLTRRVARRIHHAFGIHPRERERLTRILVRRVVPID